MHARASMFAPAVFLVCSLGMSACGDSDSALQVGAAPSPTERRLLSVEPARIAPDFLVSESCRGLPAFRTRFDLFVPAARGVLLRQLGFAFVDRTGRRTLPMAVPTSFASVTLSSSMPVPFPTSHAVPIPGTLPFHGTMVSPPLGRLGLLLNFDCGIPARGTLFIDVETADEEGAADVSHVSVPVG